MLAKFGTNSGGFTWCSNFELIQVEPHTIGQIWNQCKCGILFSWRDNSSYRLYALGPLCLWQCFFFNLSCGFDHDFFAFHDFFIKFLEFGRITQIWLKYWNMVEILKYGSNYKIRLKFWSLVGILKCVWNSKIWSTFRNLLKIWKMAQNYDGKFMSRSLVPQIEV